MCTVSKEESQTSLERLTAWAKTEKPLQGGTLGEWIFNRNNPISKQFETNNLVEESKQTDTTESLTPNAVQRNWRTPSEFPCCPQKISEDPIAIYAENLKKGKVFSRNRFSEHLVLDSAIIGQSIWVLCEDKTENPIKPWSLAQIIYENGLFVHTGRTFFSKEGAEKQFTLAQGLEWTGGDSIDDYC